MQYRTGAIMGACSVLHIITIAGNLLYDSPIHDHICQRKIFDHAFIHNRLFRSNVQVSKIKIRSTIISGWLYIEEDLAVEFNILQPDMLRVGKRQRLTDGSRLHDIAILCSAIIGDDKDLTSLIDFTGSRVRKAGGQGFPSGALSFTTRFAWAEKPAKTQTNRIKQTAFFVTSHISFGIQLKAYAFGK